jgi:hypothetical protein
VRNRNAALVGAALAAVALLVVAHVRSVRAVSAARVSTSIVTVAPATLVDLDAHDLPLSEVVAQIASRMGFTRVEDPRRTLEGHTFTGKFAQTPAWECLVVLLDKNAIAFHTTEEHALALAPAPGGANARFRASSGFIARFEQKAPGFKTPNDGAEVHPLPFDLKLEAEPRFSCSYVGATVVHQKDAVGRDCDLVGLHVQDGKVFHATAGKDAFDPWPGLSAFALEATIETVARALTVEVSNLDYDTAPVAIQNDGRELATVAVRRDTRYGFDDVLLSLASTKLVHATGTVNVEDDLARCSGTRVELRDARGAFVPADIVSLEGDGRRLEARLRYKTEKWSGQAKFAPAGGLAALTLRLTLPLETRTDKIGFEFQGL